MANGFYGNSYNSGTDDFEDIEFDKLVVRDAKKTHSRVFGALAIYLFAATALMTLTALFLADFSPSLYYKMFETTLGVYILNAVILYLICIPVFYLMIRKTETRRFYKRRISFREFFEIWAISQVLMTIGQNIGLSLNDTISKLIDKPIKDTTVEMIENSSLLSMFIFSVILAPIAEELVMRKLVIDRLSKYGSGYAITASAIAFGLFHGNFYQFFYAAFLGFVLGYLYIKGGLRYSILLHMTINFMGSVLSVIYTRAQSLLLSVDPDAIYEPTATLFGASLVALLYTLLVLGLLGFGAYLIVRKLMVMVKSFRRGEFSLPLFSDARLTIPKSSFGSSIFGNAGMIGFIIVSTLSMLLSIFG